MKYLIIMLLMPVHLFGQGLRLPPSIKMLALGDSYTIGQSVSVSNRWPVQLMDSLDRRNYITTEPRIIATTGWRTDNLISAIRGQQLQSQNFNLVSLLIGVNNQYQNRPFSLYEQEFPQLLDSAIRYAGGETNHVFIVSIPDYGYTPFGERTGNQTQISSQLDQYNAYSKQVAVDYGVQFFDITPISRFGLQQPALVPTDDLHPSGLQYSMWVSKMLAYVDSVAVSISNKTNFKPKAHLFTTQDNQKLVYELAYKPNFPSSLTISNNSGKRLIEMEVKNHKGEIDIQGLQAGVYFAKFNTGDVPVFRFAIP